MPRSNVVITGLGVVSSIGIGGDSYFQSLLEKRSGIRSLAERTDEGAKPPAGEQGSGFWIGGPIIDFDPKQYVRPRKALKVMCREIQTAFAASQLAIENAGLIDLLPADPNGEIKPRDIGTVFGSEMFYGPPDEMVDAIEGCRNEDGSIDASQFGSAAMKNIMPLWMLKYLPNMPACHVGIAVNSHGPNNSLVLGDVSGPAATIEAASCIDRGIASLMIAGATGTRINTTRLNYRGCLPVPDSYEPVEHSSRPHDPTSKGVVGGEGAAAFVLESADSAKARKTETLAKLVSYASCFIPSQSITNGYLGTNRGSAKAIRSAIDIAIRDANLRASDIGLIVSHASGDPELDAAEREALTLALPERPVVAPIASIGHTGSGSGSIEIATAVLALANQTVPPTIRVASSAEQIGFRDNPEPLQSDHVLSVTYTAEGNAMALILGRP